MTRFGSAIRQARQEREWTIRELARTADLTESYVNGIETGTRQFYGVAAARALVDALELPSWWNAVVYQEQHEARMQRDFDILPSQTRAEIERAFAECQATGKDVTVNLPESLEPGSPPPRVTWKHPVAA